MTRLLAALAAIALLAVPATAQAPEVPVAGTVVIVAGVSDGLTIVPWPGALVIPPVACGPS